MRVSVLSFDCPKCGSSADVGRSRRRGEFEKLGAIAMLRPYRCRQCNLRFLAWLGEKNRNRTLLLFALRAGLITASFWLPIHFLGSAIGIAIAGVFWLVFATLVSELA